MRRRSLRLRLIVTFGLGALALSSFFASLTFFGVQRVLVVNQQQTDLRQSFVSAALIRSTLYTSPPDLANLLNSIERATNSSVLVHTHHQWLSKSHGAATTDVKNNVVSLVGKGHVTQQTINSNGRLIFIVGVPMPAVETQVFEVFHLTNLEHTLSVLLQVLGVGAVLTSLLGMGGALWVTRRALRPLEQVSAAAALIAAGELGTRLTVSRADQEVEQLANSFNSMVTQLVERLERDARFASDVSHELRSPLTSLTTTVSVLQQHRNELSLAGRESLDLLSADLSIFSSLVEDLLVMARSDAGAITHVIETVAAIELVRQSVRSAAQRHGLDVPPLEIESGTGDPRVRVDRRRFEQIITNLLTNAKSYANGVVAVRISVEGKQLEVNVDDAGPGIAPDEREQVFERFYRGRAAHDRGLARGTGLGLALVRDHVQTVGGTIAVFDSPDGGARFQILLPVDKEASP